jgi:hypothetical protein
VDIPAEEPHGEPPSSDRRPGGTTESGSSQNALFIAHRLYPVTPHAPAHPILENNRQASFF